MPSKGGVSDKDLRQRALSLFQQESINFEIEINIFQDFSTNFI